MRFKSALMACAALGMSVCLAANDAALAYELRPMVMELSPSGSGSAANVTIVNTHQVPIAIEISVHRRDQKADGNDILVPENDDVIVTPPQMIIPPGSSQSVRVQWVGDAAPDRELAYRLVSQQLPIRIKQVTRNDRTADLTMKYRYEAALYIVPRGVEPSARLSSAEVVEEQGDRKLRLTLVSEGTKRAILDAPKITLANSGGELVIEGESAAALQGLNILPGATRVVDLPAPTNLAMGPVKAEMESRYLFTR